MCKPSKLADMLAGLLVVRVVVYYSGDNCTIGSSCPTAYCIVDVARVEACDPSPIWIDWCVCKNKTNSELT